MHLKLGWLMGLEPTTTGINFQQLQPDLVEELTTQLRHAQIHQLLHQAQMEQ